MIRFLLQSNNAETVAFAVDLACVWGTAFLALRVPRLSPRLFAALTLFILNWAILLLYYLPGPPQDEILSNFSGFLLICAGLLLVRAAREEVHGDELPLGLSDRVALYLFRATVGGFGAYLVIRRLFHIEYGYGTLALAAWGTLLTVLGYAAMWMGLVYWYRSRPRGVWVRWSLGLLLALYSLLEIGYCVWYARDVWPPYHRYLVASTRPGAPSFDAELPLEPAAGWPDRPRWDAMTRSPDWHRLQADLALKIEPKLPQMPVALEYGFSVLKLLFTGAVFGLLWRRPFGVTGPECAEGPQPEAADLRNHTGRSPTSGACPRSRPSHHADRGWS